MERDMPSEISTRQQARADKRAIFKQLRSARKADAVRNQTPSGAAAV
jgi:hypothetical protein